MSMKRTPPPASWAEDINDWLESLKAAGLSDETVRCRRCKITKAARDLAKTPLEVTAEDMVHWMASQKWKPESRKGYRNTLSSFYGWLYTTGMSKSRLSVWVAVVPAIRFTVHVVLTNCQPS